MFGGRGGMGGGSGGMLRSVGRAVTRAGVANNGLLQEPLPSSTTTTSPTPSSKPTHKSKPPNNIPLSSSALPFSTHNLPISATSGLPTWRSDEWEWVSEDGVFEDYVFGSVPSEDEVDCAVSSLQQAFDPSTYACFIRDKHNSEFNRDVDQVINHGSICKVSSGNSIVEWVEPSHIWSPQTMHPYGCTRVYDAFQLLRTEPSMQRMVKSLSSDKAVWAAVLNNEVVRELRESFYADDKNRTQILESTFDDNNPEKEKNFLRWMFDNIKMKVTEVYEKLSKIVTELFQIPNNEEKDAEAPDPLCEKLRTPFIISIMVMLVVVVTRECKG